MHTHSHTRTRKFSCTLAKLNAATPARICVKLQPRTLRILKYKQKKTGGRGNSCPLLLVFSCSKLCVVLRVFLDAIGMGFFWYAERIFFKFIIAFVRYAAVGYLTASWSYCSELILTRADLKWKRGFLKMWFHFYQKFFSTNCRFICTIRDHRVLLKYHPKNVFAPSSIEFLFFRPRPLWAFAA